MTTRLYQDSIYCTVLD